MAYRGEIAHIPLGQLGLLTDVPPGEVPRGALIRATNISYETGLVTKASGSLRYNTQVLPAGIVALFDWWPNSISQRLIAACTDGKIYRDIGDRLFSGAVAITTGLGAITPKSLFVEGGRETGLRSKKLFFYTGLNQLKVLDDDESEFANVALPAADWVTPNFPTFGFVHRNRLWSFMNQRAYASDTANHENNTSNNLTMSIFPGEGGNLIGGHVFKGRAFVYKEGGFVYYLDDESTDSDDWNWRKLSSNFGLASSHAVIEVANDMLGVNESGSPISYNAVNALGDIESADVLRLLQIEEYFRNSVSLNGIDVLHSVYYEAKKQAFFTYRSGYRANNNLLLHLDFNKERPRAALWSKDAADCLTLRKDLNRIQRPIYGSADGYVYLMDREDRLVGGSAYSGEFKIGHTDFRFLDERLAHKNKLFDYLAVEFLPQGMWNLEVDVYIDGSFSETINFPMDVRDDGLGSFTLGGASEGDALGRTETQTIQKPLHGSGRRISFVCRNSAANQNFALASLTVGFRPSAEQATRV
jgi:hypothetical protein